ncbi:MAG: plastocyanin/azurin family copper-binding protein [Longimicrobiales bacterium]|nr:plastocyanin/azurin family copper-binding protein [Longimicrobiales bacterium]
MPDDQRSVIHRREFIRASGAFCLSVMSGGACSEPSMEGEAPSSTPDDDLAPRVVGMRSLGGAFRYDPVGLGVAPGDEVHWLNMGDFHTVSAFHPDNAELIEGSVPLRIPEEAAPFHSGMLGLTAGTQFTHRFEVAGVYDYFCQPHYSFGMVGRIIVGEPRGGPALRRPSDDLNEVARRTMPSVDAILGPGGAAFEWAARVNGILYRMANEGEATAVAEAVASGMSEDDALGDWLGAQDRSALPRALSSLMDAASGAADYQVVLQRADEVKKVLRSPRGRR